MEPLYRTSLYQKTLKDVPKMQQKKSLQEFFMEISWLGIEPPFLITLILFNLVSKINALYIWTAFSWALYMCCILKEVYGEPRPYWVSTEILSP